MLTDTDELETAWRALAGQTAEKGWRTVALGHSSPRFRGGIVFPEGEETLLVGFNVGSEVRKADLPEGTGFRVDISKETFSAGYSTWLCLSRQSGAGRDLFVQMAADIVSALSRATAQSDSWLLSLMLARIRAWQEFMRKPRTDLLRPEEELGLFGELTFMREAIAGGASAADVVHAWNGPSRSLQDFQTAAIGVEVKATLSANSFSAHVSSLEQLDGMNERAVLLAATRFSLHDEGLTLPELIDRVRQLAGDAGVLSTLNRTLMLSGFVDEASERYKGRFTPIDTRVFEINETFPALVRSRIGPEIRAAEYEIDLDLVTSVPLTLPAAMQKYGVFSE
ncbi:PD-(D/E)XK motif protein [Pseudorhizobium pelagicum]|uniref:PD-(D/E)XK motif protein n=1 Tax=Pseudorhizobium pelagicum TaxID=1509405 RepID=UPI00069057DE|nr:PD-(D/E)XK motif protein [Pseudorhizobium pelagicum]